MELVEYDETLTDEQRQVRDIARKFSKEVLRPAGIALDKMTPEADGRSRLPFLQRVAPGPRVGFRPDGRCA